MTKRVAVRGKRQRAGEGGRPVRVKGRGRSLSSSRDERRAQAFPVVSDGIPPLWENVSFMTAFPLWIVRGSRWWNEEQGFVLLRDGAFFADPFWQSGSEGRFSQAGEPGRGKKVTVMTKPAVPIWCIADRQSKSIMETGKEGTTKCTNRYQPT